MKSRTSFFIFFFFSHPLVWLWARGWGPATTWDPLMAKMDGFPWKQPTRPYSSSTGQHQGASMCYTSQLSNTLFIQMHFLSATLHA